MPLHRAARMVAGDDLSVEFRHMFMRCSGFHAREPQQLLTSFFDKSLEYNRGQPYEHTPWPEFMFHPDGLRGALQASSDACTEYAVIAGLILSAIVGLLFDWETGLDYNAATGVLYAASIGFSVSFLLQGTMHAALFRGNTLYISRDVDIFVAHCKSAALNPDVPRDALLQGMQALLPAIFIRFQHFAASENRNNVLACWQGWLCIVLTYLYTFCVLLGRNQTFYNYRQTRNWAEGWKVVWKFYLWLHVPFMERPFNWPKRDPWGREHSWDEDDDMYDAEVLKEEFAFRTKVAIALAKNQGREVPASQISPILRPIVDRLPDLHIPPPSKLDPLPVSYALRKYLHGGAEDGEGDGVAFNHPAALRPSILGRPSALSRTQHDRKKAPSPPGRDERKPFVTRGSE